MLDNETRIQLTELAAAGKERLASLRRRRAAPVFIEGLDIFCEGRRARRRALLSLRPTAWLRAVSEEPEIRFFNADGLTFEVVRALNRLGFVVDIVDWEWPDFNPARKYDFYLGHGRHSRTVLERLPKGVFVLHYASGAYWQAFNQMSEERYRRFQAATGCASAGEFRRSLVGSEEGEEVLARSADATFLSGPRTLATFEGVARRLCLLYLGAYVDQRLQTLARDYSRATKHFLYVAGTSGNIQKGLDVLIEAFAACPGLHLHIHCRVEPEIRLAYAAQLRLPNLHYTYHYTSALARPLLQNLYRRCAFTVTAPIDTGPGTAFLGSMGTGLIPVGYSDIEASDGESVLVDSWHVEAIQRAVRAASERAPDWCAAASKATLQRFARLHEPTAFGSNFQHMLADMGV